MTSPAEISEPPKPRRNVVARALDLFYGVLNLDQEPRSSGQQLVSLLVLVSAVAGVPLACLSLAKSASRDAGVLINLFIPVWLFLLFVGAVGYGLRCPSCRKWWSRRTNTYAETEGPEVIEQLPSFEKPGTLDVTRRRTVSRSGTYRCKRCGHGWSVEASGERVR